jgi:predicted lipoprotein DUF2279
MRFKFILLFFIFPSFIIAQQKEKLSFFEPADTFNHWRFWGCAGAGATIYTGVMIGLNEVWYSEYERSKFHFFNDFGEWEDMDKMGHMVTAYTEANWVYKGARWTGMGNKKSIWLGVALGSLFQASFETLDGFAKDWGFSVPDIAFNTIGVTAFATQQFIWNEQRIVLKISSYHKPYPKYFISSVDGSSTTFLPDRTNDLYGTSYATRFFKDYNAMTVWASVNVSSFMKNKNSRIPKWFNVAVGYGAENMYGGFRNEWSEDEAMYVLSEDDFPRYRQFYLSLDIDLTRIKTKSHFLKTVFSIVNVIKIPAPALEINTLGKVRFHPIYF